MGKGTALVPRTLPELSEFAQRLSASKLLPPDLRSQADIAVTLLQGMELGLRPMQALRSIHIVKGKPVLSADLIVALVMRSPHCQYFRLVSSDTKAACYETQRQGNPEPVRLSFTIEDAKRAGLDKRDTWKAHPAAMLRARAKAHLAREVYPDIAMGLYETGEREHLEPTQEYQATELRTTSALPVIDAHPVDRMRQDAALDQDHLPQWAGGPMPDPEIDATDLDGADDGTQ